MKIYDSYGEAHRQSARQAYLSWKIEIGRDWYCTEAKLDEIYGRK
jgi:hypothetical protein